MTCFKPVDTELLTDYIEQTKKYRVRFDVEELAADFTEIRDTSFIDLDYDNLFDIHSKAS